MSRPPWLAWLLLALWSAWLFALQAWFERAGGLGAWVPDLGLALLVALAARLPSADLPWVGLAVGIARASVTIDPPAAVLAAYLGAVALARALRSTVEIKSPPVAALLAFLLALGVNTWLAWVHFERAAAALASPPPGLAPAPAWRPALATALAAAFLGPALARLPGLTPLRRRKPWRVGASFP